VRPSSPASKSTFRWWLIVRRDRRHLATVTSQVLYQTHFTSPQPLLPEVSLDYWQKAILRTRRRRRRRPLREPIQSSLFGIEEAAAER